MGTSFSVDCDEECEINTLLLSRTLTDGPHLFNV